ncbi:MAG TPA: polyprenol monophosphomannose synthase [Acidimicrobiales bacterium]|nr:polyprenol monophosphomannose synthase [Acidimicrobiales bacterium]
MRVLVVLPTYNEAENISNVLALVRRSLPEASVLVVDDNSPDGTADLAEKAGQDLGGIEVLRRPGKSGLGSAYRDGFRWGLERGYDVLVEMDSDLSHDPAALPSIVAPLEAGKDVVIGSRYVPGGSIPDWSLSRRLISRGGNVFAAVMLGLPVKDSTAGYRAYAARILEKVDLSAIRADSYGFQIEMTYRTLQAGAEIEEVPIRFVDRTLGSSKMSTYTVAEAFALVTLWGIERLARRLSPAGRGRRGGRA